MKIFFIKHLLVVKSNKNMEPKLNLSLGINKSYNPSLCFKMNGRQLKSTPCRFDSYPPLTIIKSGQSFPLAYVLSSGNIMNLEPCSRLPPIFCPWLNFLTKSRMVLF